MRVAPIGTYFADDLDAVIENARRSAMVTHAHPEAAAGAIAVALAAALLRQAHTNNSSWDGRDFLKQVLDLTPRSEVQEGIRHARGMVEEGDVREAAAVLGVGERVTAQDTVPFCLWCAARHPDSFDDALWLTVSGLGDRDTTCAIVGGIVAAGVGIEGIPAAWLQSREPLPDWPFRND
jgi:ADP-ribosylglycohydrolase